MAIKFEKLQPGMVLLDIHKTSLGNTTLSQWGMWKVHVISVNPKERTAVVSWNGNAEQTWEQRRLERLYTKPTKAYLKQQEARRARGGY